MSESVSSFVENLPFPSLVGVSAERVGLALEVAGKATVSLVGWVEIVAVSVHFL